MSEMTNQTGGFYEDDEPIEHIRAAWDRGVKGTTQPPQPDDRLTANVPRTVSFTLVPIDSIAVSGSTCVEQRAVDIMAGFDVIVS